MHTTSNILHLADRYLSETSVAPTTLALNIGGTRHFLRNLQKGKTMLLTSYDFAIRWFDANWPQHLEWPKDISRPSTELTRCLACNAPATYFGNDQLRLCDMHYAQITKLPQDNNNASIIDSRASHASFNPFDSTRISSPSRQL